MKVTDESLVSAFNEARLYVRVYQAAKQECMMRLHQSVADRLLGLK